MDVCGFQQVQDLILASGLSLPRAHFSKFLTLNHLIAKNRIHIQVVRAESPCSPITPHQPSTPYPKDNNNSHHGSSKEKNNSEKNNNKDLCPYLKKRYQRKGR